MKLKQTSYFINKDSSATGSVRLTGKRLAVLCDFHNGDHETVLDILRNDIPDEIMIPGDLVLSGHAHGGQWSFMGRGIIAPGQGWFPKYTSGVHQGQYGSMIISRGLSNPYKSVPRIGNPCEVVYVVL